MGGAEKGGIREGESSVQLFNNWRNSRALENSLTEKTNQEKKKRKKDIYSHALINSHQLSKLLSSPLPYPESFLRLPASESLCGWMRVWMALSKSFLQKQRWSWAMGSAGGRTKRVTVKS